jgi:hypothetical protein
MIDVANHVMSEEPGLTYYPNTIRHSFKTRLAEYPRQLTNIEKQRVSIFENMFYRNVNIITHITEIYAGEYKYFLCWQNGFDQYLKKEYTLNDDIWIYGAVVTYSIWDKCGYFFIRDFSLESLEKKYENRLKIINEKSNL